MDNGFDILFFVVLIAFYVFRSLFSRDKEEEEELPPPKRRFQKSHEETEAERQYAERQRHIREEIRRKIEARRQASGGERQGKAVPTLTPSVSPQPSVAGRDDHGREVKEPFEARPRAMPIPDVAPETFDNAYERTIEMRLKQIQKTERKAAALRERMSTARNKTNGGTTRNEHTVKHVRFGPVRENLRNPEHVRAAFIYGEVFGRPVGLRKGDIGMEFKAT